METSGDCEWKGGKLQGRHDKDKCFAAVRTGRDKDLGPGFPPCPGKQDIEPWFYTCEKEKTCVSTFQNGGHKQMRTFIIISLLAMALLVGCKGKDEKTAQTSATAQQQQAKPAETKAPAPATAPETAPAKESATPATPAPTQAPAPASSAPTAPTAPAAPAEAGK
jgi:hypothetical protein